MRLGYVQSGVAGETNALLAALAGTARARGLRVCGTVQVNTATADPRHCDMDVRVLPGGPVLRISQRLGQGARGCRLDPGALEQAVALSRRALEAGADLMIVNKFGKHEAEGRGFRDLIAEALERGVPVIVGLNGLNRAAFLDFAGPLAEEVAPSAPDLADWLIAAGPVAA